MWWTIWGYLFRTQYLHSDNDAMTLRPLLAIHLLWAQFKDATFNEIFQLHASSNSEHCIFSHVYCSSTGSINVSVTKFKWRLHGIACGTINIEHVLHFSSCRFVCQAFHNEGEISKQIHWSLNWERVLISGVNECIVAKEVAHGHIWIWFYSERLFGYN